MVALVGAKPGSGAQSAGAPPALFWDADSGQTPLGSTSVTAIPVTCRYSPERSTREYVATPPATKAVGATDFCMARSSAVTERSVSAVTVAPPPATGPW